MRASRVGLLVLAMGVWNARAAFAEERTEDHPDGTRRLEYAVDEEGRKHGQFREFYADGQLRLRCQYKAGMLHGRWATYHENGKPHELKTYRNGKLHGPFVVRDEKGETVLQSGFRDGRKHGKILVYRAGKVVSTQNWRDGDLVSLDRLRPFPRSLDEIAKELRKLESRRRDRGSEIEIERSAALCTLRQYRYLVGVPYADVELDDELNALAHAGAALCRKVGRLDHTPPNPGMRGDEYEFALRGTKHCNLGQVGNLVACVHGFMNDSDPSNIDRVGHRRWCLNPGMKKTGFGKDGEFGAMWAHDESRRGRGPPYVLFPPKGYMPRGFFDANWAWSCSLDGEQIARFTPADVKVRVVQLGEDYAPGDEVEIGYFKLATGGMGMEPCVIFRPKGIDIRSDARFRVRISGVLPRESIDYVVEFVDLPAETK